MRLLALFLLAIVPLTAAAADPAPGQQVDQQLELDGGATMPYLLHLPKEYGSDDRKWPLMLFLHGRGESNGPLSVVKKWGPPKMAERGDQLPCIVVSPQCPRESQWTAPEQQAGLLKLLDHVEKTFAVDPTRVWLTGLSMGGYGSWRLAADHPKRFAAVAPVCGGGDTKDAAVLAGLPIWVWHGTEDGAVPFERSKSMVEAIRKAGGKTIRFTVLEGIGHNCWSAAYATPELWQWMGKQRRESAKAP